MADERYRRSILGVLAIESFVSADSYYDITFLISSTNHLYFFASSLHFAVCFVLEHGGFFHLCCSFIWRSMINFLLDPFGRIVQEDPPTSLKFHG